MSAVYGLYLSSYYWISSAANRLYRFADTLVGMKRSEEIVSFGLGVEKLLSNFKGLSRSDCLKTNGDPTLTEFICEISTKNIYMVMQWQIFQDRDLMFVSETVLKFINASKKVC